jgi:hypothetical protein
MGAIELLPVVLCSMLLGGSVGWFWYDDFSSGVVIGFIGSFVVLGVVALGATGVRRLKEAADTKRSASR